MHEIQIVTYKLSDLTRVAYDFGTANFTDLSGWTFANDAQQILSTIAKASGLLVVTLLFKKIHV
jgi:hypothetical protein